jgi:hypothetical protein
MPCFAWFIDENFCWAWFTMGKARLPHSLIRFSVLMMDRILGIEIIAILITTRICL